MNDFFDEKQWSEIIKKPNWYFTIIPELEEIKKKLDNASKDKIESYKEAVYSFFERHLKEGTLALGNQIGNWDLERKPIDTIIIHHTKNPPGMSLERLSAMELVRLYARYYFDPKHPTDFHIKSQPISSGHIRDGRQSFLPYHWFIRNGGNIERLLEDNQIGWQAGDWEVNCRSVAICIDDDLSISEPTDVILEAVAELIKDNYSNVPRENILGHREVNLKTECPGNLFLGPNGWKDKFLKILEE